MALELVSGSMAQLVLFCGERVIAEFCANDGKDWSSSEAKPDVAVCSLSRRCILDVH